MKKTVFDLKALSLFTVVALTFACQNAASAEVTRPHEFITDLVQDIGSITEIRDRTVADIEGSQGDLLNTATDCIRNSTSLQLELGSQIEQFKNVHLASQFIELPANIVFLWQGRLQIEKRMTELCKALLNNPNDLVTIRTATGEMAELGARLDYIDQSVFKGIMPMSIMSLVSDRPDSEGHMSFLVMSRQEIIDLVKQIDLTFGDKLKEKKPKYLVASIVLLRQWLDQKGYRASDEQ